MINRRLENKLRSAVGGFPVVALLGPRQVGKTTLARAIAASLPNDTVYLDLERPSDASKLTDPEQYLTRQFGKTVIIDEVQRRPELFPTLRALVDEQTRQGLRAGQYLVLGSASRDLLRQSSETLAGRIAYLELTPFTLDELQDDHAVDTERHWIRGGFPDSFLAESAELSRQWLQNFIATYLERDLPQLGIRLPAEQLRRFWTMLGHGQGASLNAARLASSLAVSGSTIRRYLDLLTDLYMVRQLSPWSGNSTKRLVKSPKVYVRDTGLLHSLTQIPDVETLLGHPLCGPSWEGYVIENLCAPLPAAWRASYYRTSAQAEIDLVLEGPRGRTLAIEIKRSIAPRVSRGFRNGCDDIAATERFIVMPSGERHSLGESIEAISISDLLADLCPAFAGT